VKIRAIEFLKNAITARLGYRCETCPAVAPLIERKMMLVGPPNVGKSVIFNELTGTYAVVSNYPGTTVEVSRGQTRIGDTRIDVLDSPGAYSLAPISEDERVTQQLLMDEPVDLVLHVVDAKNLRRMLPMTFQLIEAGMPLALDVNIIDEVERSGHTINADCLSEDLDLPAVTTAATLGIGMEKLRGLLADGMPDRSGFRVQYPGPIESAIAQIGSFFTREYGIASRAFSLLLLQRDSSAWEKVQQLDPDAVVPIERVVRETEGLYSDPLGYPIAIARQEAADQIVQRSLTPVTVRTRPDFRQLIGALTMHPVAGIPILVAVLYVGLYLIVGRLGAGVFVDALDQHLFVRYINPASEALINKLLPPTIAELFVGEYGLITLGLRYAIAIVLPLVGAFFLVFAVLEDSGYLPRLAMLVDRLFKRIGLSGRAVIPIVLGLGCGTMATIVTRVLETRRERIIATFLLALAIPCSAQLGVILGLLSGIPLGLAIWSIVVGGVFLLSGALAARLVPGESPCFYLEIPPIRRPSLRNIGIKTFSRLKWYAAEVIPVFLLASVLIWVGQLVEVFDVLILALRPAVHLIGLPDTAADAFLFGFLRRDYGAARIFDVHGAGIVSGIPLVVAMVTINLFVPCVAQFLVMIRERGWRMAFAVGAIILPFALGVGYLLNIILTTLQVQL